MLAIIPARGLALKANVDTDIRLRAILVTYQRPAELATTLASIAQQTRQPDDLVVVDNGPSAESQAVVREIAGRFTGSVNYLPMPENLGYTGGVRVGMQHLLPDSADDDWFVICDDDDPPSMSDAFEKLVDFGVSMASRSARTGAVGLGGGRFDFRRGEVVRVPTAELHDAVPLDYIAGNAFGCYRVSAIREVGPWSSEIFFGFSEGEYGLRLRRAGFHLWADGDTWRELRAAAGRSNHQIRQSRRLDPVGWRRYYSLRNVVWILRQHGRNGAAVRVSLVRGIVKPLANVLWSPRLAIAHLYLNARAIRDAWTGRMGRRVEPVPWGPRPDRLLS